MDVLADILATTELTSELYFRASLRAPFAIEVPASPGRTRFHVTGAGRVWVELPTGEGQWCERGDLVLVPHGSAHILADAPGTTATPLADVLASRPDSLDRELTYAGSGSLSELVCGHFAYAREAVHPMLDALPPLVRIGCGENRNHEWIDVVLRAIDSEARSARPGFASVVRRLSEVIFIEVLREFIAEAENPLMAQTALTALVDPHIGRALEAVHAEPGRGWTLDQMASAAGLSRTLFTARFRERLACSPMRYLAGWRMEKARNLLHTSELGLAEVARSVGYESEAAFNRAFKERFGMPPGSWRRSQLPASTAAAEAS